MQEDTRHDRCRTGRGRGSISCRRFHPEEPLPSPRNTGTRRAANLTPEEEITLRRVAFGQSEVRAMRQEDLARLRRLGLIEDASDGPRLTAKGKLRFDALGRPSAIDSAHQYEAMLAEFSRRMPRRSS